MMSLVSGHHQRLMPPPTETEDNKDTHEDSTAKNPTETNSRNEEEPLALRYCYVTNANKTMNDSQAHSTHDFLLGTANALHLDVKDERRKYSTSKSKSRRSSAPVNEFEQGDMALVGANPDVFLLGRAYGKKKGTLTQKQTTHLLLQFTNNAASCSNLLFLLFDQKQRHSVIGSMHAKIRHDPAAFEKFTRTFMSKEFQTKIQRSVADPEGRDAKEVLKKLVPILTVGGKRTVFGALERRAAAGEILAMGRMFGPASNFLTVSVDDIHSPGVFRMAFRSCNNLTFPAFCPDSLLTALEIGTKFTCRQNGMCIHGEKCLGSGSVPIPCNWSFLAEKTTENPVSVAQYYKKLIHDLMSILVGIIPASTSDGDRRTLTTNFGGWGRENLGVIVGTPVAFIGVTETTGKGSLHFHVGTYWY